MSPASHKPSKKGYSLDDPVPEWLEVRMPSSLPASGEPGGSLLICDGTGESPGGDFTAAAPSYSETAPSNIPDKPDTKERGGNKIEKAGSNRRAKKAANHRA